MKRKVKVSLASYVDVEGRERRGWQGDEVDVHDDHVAVFDAAQAVAVGERVVTSPSEPELEREPVKAKATRSRVKADG